MFREDSSSRDPITGTWGATKMKEFGLNQGGDRSASYSTETRDTYSMSNLTCKSSTIKDNQYAKFNTLKQTAPILIEYHAVQRDMKEHFSNLSSNNNQESSVSPKMLAMTRSQSRFLRSSEAPVARGRAGHKFQGQRAKISLVGERYNNCSDPISNSNAQRTWLYAKDPSLDYMEHGIPQAYVPNDVSLAIGTGNETYQEGASYGRKAILTGDPLSKSGSLRAGVFMDEYGS